MLLSTIPARALSWCATALLAGLAAVHFSSTLTTVALYTLQNAYQDQFRLYSRYLTVPFPLSILELENGHRPILPALLRWVELTYLHGAQTLQFATAWTAAAAATYGIVRMTWRDLDRIRLAVLVCVLSVTVLWNANARMFIHAYEATHVFYIYAALVAAIALVSADEEVSLSRLIAASVCGLLATFSFGPGIVLFPTLFGLLVLRRAKFGLLAFTAAFTFAVFLAYTYVLPGADGVRGASVGFSLQSAIKFVALRFSAYWLELFPGAAFADARSRLPVVVASSFVVALTLLSVLSRWFRREVFSRSHMIGVGFVLFGVLTNAVIAVNRVSHFELHAQDVLAERYLFWSAVLWLGVALYWLTALKAGAKFRTVCVAVFVAIVAIVAIQRANWWRSWSSSVFRMVELTAVAYRHGIAHPHRLIEIAGPDTTETLNAVENLRSAQAMIFASGSESWLSTRIAPAPTNPTVPLYHAWEAPDTRDLPSGSTWRIVGTEIPRTTAHRLAGTHFWLADAGGKVVGDCARTGSRRESSDYARYFRPIYNRLDCYVLKEADAPLVLISTNLGRASYVGTLALAAAPR